MQNKLKFVEKYKLEQSNKKKLTKNSAYDSSLEPMVHNYELTRMFNHKKVITLDIN